jgi:hypothetical protein
MMARAAAQLETTRQAYPKARRFCALSGLAVTSHRLLDWSKALQHKTAC